MKELWLKLKPNHPYIYLIYVALFFIGCTILAWVHGTIWSGVYVFATGFALWNFCERGYDATSREWKEIEEKYKLRKPMDDSDG